jgi:hypothetical protein
MIRAPILGAAAMACLMLTACTDPKANDAAEADITNAAKALEQAADLEVNRAIADLEREAAARRASEPMSEESQPANEADGEPAAKEQSK